MVTLRESWVLAVLSLVMLCAACDDPSVTSVALVAEDDQAVPVDGNVDLDVDGCTAANEVCFTVRIPEGLQETPEALIVGLYTQLPPAGPPSVYPPFRMDTPEVTPGEALEVKMSVEETGTYQAYTVLYMPNGGLKQWVPMAGVDYSSATAPFELTGDAYSHEAEIVLELAAQ